MKKLNRYLQELKSKYLTGIITKQQYLRELDDMIKYAENREQIEFINSYKDLDI